MLNVRLAVLLAVAGDAFDGVFLCCLFSRDVLNEIWDLIESVSKGFPTYSRLYHGFNKNGYIDLN